MDIPRPIQVNSHTMFTRDNPMIFEAAEKYWHSSRSRPIFQLPHMETFKINNEKIHLLAFQLIHINLSLLVHLSASYVFTDISSASHNHWGYSKHNSGIWTNKFSIRNRHEFISAQWVASGSFDAPVPKTRPKISIAIATVQGRTSRVQTNSIRIQCFQCQKILLNSRPNQYERIESDQRCDRLQIQ